MRFYSHLQSARQIIETYNGREPFHRFIRAFFAQHKKFGSRDRKQISGLCYAWWRMGAALSALPMEDKLLAALLLCNKSADPVIEQLKPEWISASTLSIPEKFTLITGNPDAWQQESVKIFPWLDQLSNDIEADQFLQSFFVQPDLFLRARPGKEKLVSDKLSKAAISFEQVTPAAFAVPNSSKIDELIRLNTEAVVQDLSSQQVAEFMEMVPVQSGAVSVWDCCAGSGGKTILAFDTIKKLSITVSDKREQILVNLAKRFKEAGIGQYQSFLTDMSIGSGRQPSKYNYNLVMADVPCSGSGTWGRTPEWLSFFEENAIDNYSQLQKRIVSNAIPHTGKAGYFLYITCSVFRKENEYVVQHILANSKLELVRAEIIKGYHRRSDTMFAALFRNPD